MRSRAIVYLELSAVFSLIFNPIVPKLLYKFLKKTHAHSCKNLYIYRFQVWWKVILEAELHSAANITAEELEVLH